MGPICFSGPTYPLLLSSFVFPPLQGSIGPSCWAQLSPKLVCISLFGPSFGFGASSGLM